MIIDDKLTLNLDDTIALMVNLELPIIPVLLNHPDSNLNKKPLNNNQVAGACYHQGYLTAAFEEAARRADGYFQRDKLVHRVQGKVNVGIGLALEPPHLICIDFDNHPDKFIPHTT